MWFANISSWKLSFHTFDGFLKSSKVFFLFWWRLIYLFLLSGFCLWCHMSNVPVIYFNQWYQEEIKLDQVLKKLWLPLCDLSFRICTLGGTSWHDMRSPTEKVTWQEADISRLHLAKTWDLWTAPWGDFKVDFLPVESWDNCSSRKHPDCRLLGDCHKHPTMSHQDSWFTERIHVFKCVKFWGHLG